MCTLGARILNPGHEYLLFKNRDFTRSHYDDAITLTAKTFGALGLESWDEAASEDTFSGFAFGFSEHLACASAFVGHAEGEVNFDELVQAVVEDSTTIDAAVACIRRKLANNHYGWTNLVLATTDEVAAVEVRGHEIGIERSLSGIIRTNHHICLSTNDDSSDTHTTYQRYQAAQSQLEAVNSADDLMTLLASHFPDAEHGICQHGALNTVYSYIVHCLDGKITLYVHQGQPCDGRPYAVIPLHFGGTNDLSGYPSRRELARQR